MGNAIEGKTTTDKTGKFAFESNVNYKGTYLAQFNMRDSEKGKKQWTRLGIDRWFSPKLRPLNAQDLIFALYSQSDTIQNIAPKRTFEWKDTIPRAISSIKGVAEVVVRKRYKGFTGNRYTWMGGETYGMKKTSKYIPLQMEYEKKKDAGELLRLELKFFLQMLDKNFEFNSSGSFEEIDTTKVGNTLLAQIKQSTMPAIPTEATHITKNIFYKGHPISVFWNNIPVDDINTMGVYDLLCNDPIECFQSATFVTENKGENVLTGKEIRANQAKYSLFLYEVPDIYRIKGKKGTEFRHIRGFSTSPKFYSPNYRRFDVPTDDDTRRTLLWSPKVKMDKNGEANLILYNNARDRGTVDISVRGLNRNGKIISKD